MGEDPDRIRHEIEETRAQFERDRRRPTQSANEIDETRTEMTDTMSALGHKADVKSRVKESVSEKKDSLVGRVSSGKEPLSARPTPSSRP